MSLQFLFRILAVALCCSGPALAGGFETFESRYTDTTRTKSRFVLGGNGYKLAENIDPREAIVILYTHGSGGDTAKDRCVFNSLGHRILFNLGNSQYPKVFKALRKRDPRISVYYVCHRETGTLGLRVDGKIKSARWLERYRRTPWLGPTVNNISTIPGLPKFCKRVKKIAYEVMRLMDENPGLTPERIFLSGGSSGAWASLLLQAHQHKAKKQRIAAGVIAFAPATNGRLSQQLNNHFSENKEEIDRFHLNNPCTDDRDKLKETTLAKWKNYVRHRCQLKFISKFADSALIFAYAKDPFNQPSMLVDHQNWKPGLVVMPVEENNLKEICGRPPVFPGNYPHACHQGSGFIARYADTIYDYILSRL